MEMRPWEEEALAAIVFSVARFLFGDREACDEMRQRLVRRALHYEGITAEQLRKWANASGQMANRSRGTAERSE
jgi:hypothetical protein